MIEAKSLSHIQKEIDENVGVLLYFSTPTCNVCKALKPKINKDFANNFPLIKQIFIDSSILPEVAAHFRVFSVPTIILFLDKKEFLREGRNVSISLLNQKVKRVYDILIN